MQQVVEGPLAEFVDESGGLTVARAEPATVPAVVDVATTELPLVQVDNPDDLVPALLAGDVPAARTPRAARTGLLVHAQAYKGDQTRVLSMWNSADPAGVLAYALDELGDRGYLDAGESREAKAAVTLAGALLVAVAALEAAQVEEPGLGLARMGVLLRELLDRGTVPAAATLELTGAGVEHADSL